MEQAFLLRLPKGDDLLDSLTRVFRERGIKSAHFTVIGALKRATLAYYDDVQRRYVSRDFDGLREIAACMGNVSEKDGDTFVHAHMILSGEDFGCVGGHLTSGSEIFAAELMAVPVPGPVGTRKFDEATGLYLWA
ncbi:MAG: PPC domain-containing DNA-binding protein [Pseudomonadota bacterium]